MAVFPVRYETASVTPDMWQDRLGGLEALMKDLEDRVPEQLVQLARAQYGMELGRNPKMVVGRQQRRVTTPTGETYLVYKVCSEAWFSPTRCVPEYHYHHHPHSNDCAAR